MTSQDPESAVIWASSPLTSQLISSRILLIKMRCVQYVGEEKKIFQLVSAEVPTSVFFCNPEVILWLCDVI